MNPVTSSELTESIRLPMDARFDYILPCGLLYSKIVSSEVFRTDVLSPLPVGLVSDDDKMASHHLPVIMYFSNPYGGPFRLLSVTRSHATVTLAWESISNRPYGVQASSNLTTWSTYASNLTATGAVSTLVTNISRTTRCFRVSREP